MKILKESFSESGGYIVYSEQNKSKLIGGSERMLAVGGGVRAKIMKTSDGEAVIESFIFDRDRFDQTKAQKWVEKNVRTIEKSLQKVQENLPPGSFQDITLRVQQALNSSSLFPVDYDGCGAYVCYAYPDFVIVDFAGNYYKVTYTDDSGAIMLGAAEKVDVTFVAKEAQAFTEKFKKHSRPNVEFSEKQEVLSIVEGSVDESKREVVAVLIEAGTNYSKKRHYPKDAIREAAPLFASLKNFIDHPTAEEEVAKPERSIKDWVSSIVESWYDDELGAVLGRVHIHDDWLWEHMKDPVFRESIGLSILASGKRYMKEIDGQQMQVIEKIFSPKSVDWVTEAGARGRVLYLVESQKKESEMKLLETMTLTELREARPDAFKKFEADLRESIAKEFETQKAQIVKEAKEPLEKELKDLKESNQKSFQKAKIAEAVNASTLPAKAKAKLIESLCVSLYENDEKLASAVKDSVEAELNYIAEVSGRKVGVNSGVKETAGGHKELTAGLEARVGIKEAKEEEKK